MTFMVGTTPPGGRGVGRGRSDVNADAELDEEGEAREGGNLGEGK